MDLICYLHPIWRPLIRPAEPTREWMDGAEDSYPYRCLPLNIANAHGWEFITPYPFKACWDGGASTGAVTLMTLPQAEEFFRPMSIFGQGVLTFRIQGLFRTPPGWNLWVGGPPNRFKDAIQPLTGIVETDWAPYTFTMNWRFTRPNEWITFEAGEPICFFFPIPRGYLAEVNPRFEPLAADPDTERKFLQWANGRQAFQAQVEGDSARAPQDRWQKDYYRGVDPDGEKGTDTHEVKLRLKPFA